MIRQVLLPVLMLVAASAHAAGNAERGRRIVEGGTANAQACAACHGSDGAGNGQMQPVAPRLVGQNGDYLAKQLHDFAAGTRASPVMEPIAKALNAQEMADVSAFFATRAGTAYPAPPRADISLLRHGEMLAREGSATSGVQACDNCHGPGGMGLGAPFPGLAGQFEAYLQTQLDNWANGSRHNDPLGAMPSVARSLTPDEARAVAAYYAATRPQETEPLVAERPE